MFCWASSPFSSNRAQALCGGFPYFLFKLTEPFIIFEPTCDHRYIYLFSLTKLSKKLQEIVASFNMWAFEPELLSQSPSTSSFQLYSHFGNSGHRRNTCSCRFRFKASLTIGSNNESTWWSSKHWNDKSMRAWRVRGISMPRLMTRS